MKGRVGGDASYDPRSLRLESAKYAGCATDWSMVGVAQLVEPRVVIPVVVGSSPIVHPIF